jgi:hypothetical protein
LPGLRRVPSLHDDVDRATNADEHRPPPGEATGAVAEDGDVVMPDVGDDIDPLARVRSDGFVQRGEQHGDDGCRRMLSPGRRPMPGW